MKFILISALALSLGAHAAATYEPNDGSSAPGTFTSKSTTPTSKDKKDKGTIKYYEETTTIIKDTNTGTGAGAGQTSDKGLENSSNVKTDDVNNAVTPAPQNEEEVIDNSTLSTP